MEIEVISMDITKIGERADAIVNAANESLLGGGGVDGAIHAAAGPDLYRECLTLGGCKPGEAKATKAYRLKNKYIIHTVGPIYYLDPSPRETLSNAYRNSLKLADELGIETIAFPSISTGVYSYPFEEAAEACAEAICNYKPKTLKKVYMCIYHDDRLMQIYRDAFAKYGK